MGWLSRCPAAVMPLTTGALVQVGAGSWPSIMSALSWHHRGEGDSMSASSLSRHPTQPGLHGHVVSCTSPAAALLAHHTLPPPPAGSLSCSCDLKTALLAASSLFSSCMQSLSAAITERCHHLSNSVAKTASAPASANDFRLPVCYFLQVARAPLCLQTAATLAWP